MSFTLNDGQIFFKTDSHTYRIVQYLGSGNDNSVFSLQGDVRRVLRLTSSRNSSFLTQRIERERVGLSIASDIQDDPDVHVVKIHSYGKYNFDPDFRSAFSQICKGATPSNPGDRACENAIPRASGVYAILDPIKMDLFHSIVHLTENPNTVVDPHIILNCMIRLCKTLRVLHSKGWVHLDIKPENIAVDNLLQLDTAKLFDWGTAQRIKDGIAITCGTPAYWPPNHTADHRQRDVYALGKVLFWIVSLAIAKEQSHINAVTIAFQPDVDQRLDQYNTQNFLPFFRKRLERYANFGILHKMEQICLHMCHPHQRPNMVAVCLYLDTLQRHNPLKRQRLAPPSSIHTPSQASNDSKSTSRRIYTVGTV